MIDIVKKRADSTHGNTIDELESGQNKIPITIRLSNASKTKYDTFELNGEKIKPRAFGNTLESTDMSELGSI